MNLEKKPMTKEEEADYDRNAAIEEAIDDAISDDEGRLTPETLEYHLTRHGFVLYGPVNKEELAHLKAIIKLARRMGPDSPIIHALAEIEMENEANGKV
jgi:hypothetical protein